MTPQAFLTSYLAAPTSLWIGLMSGTSVDGVDAALVELSGSGRETQATLVGALTYPIAPALRQDVLTLSHGGGDAALVSTTAVALATVFAEAAQAVCAATATPLSSVSAVASHGQTISHTPAQAATLQIGNAAVLAQALGVPVVSDFRSADLAVGGQGAPLIPYVDWCLFTHPEHSRAIQNIGGIGNVTFLPAGAARDDVIGFDTGPGNMLIDRAAQWATDQRERFDRDGHLARQGRCDADLLAWLMTHPFLQRVPPKSAGREEFGEAFWQEVLVRAPLAPVDLVATLTRFTAESIASAYRRFLPTPPAEVVVGGGGARNPVLCAWLTEALGGVPVHSHEALGWDSDAKEALAFCVLGNEAVRGVTANLPRVTGARCVVCLGSLTFP